MDGHGPVDDLEAPERLSAWAVDPEGKRLHGYDLETDLATHYRFGEVLLLALRGSAPTEAEGAAFELALVFLLPVGSWEGPAHAGVLARTCGARPAGTVAIAGLACAEEAGMWVEEHTEWLAWLPSSDGPMPACARARDAEDGRTAEALAARVGEAGLDLGDVRGCGTQAVVFAVFWACGLRTADHWIAGLVAARLPGALAEAGRHRHLGFADYPIRLPPFRYTGDL